MWVFALILGLPLVEISLYVTLGAWLGVWWTLAIVIGTALLGLWLIRSQGTRTGADLRATLMSRKNPTQALAGGALTLLSGVLLILPGFLTDAVGLLLLLPPVQRWVAHRLTLRARDQMASHVQARMWEAATTRRNKVDPKIDVIDATWEELPEGEDTPPRGPRSGWTRH